MFYARFEANQHVNASSRIWWTDCTELGADGYYQCNEDDISIKDEDLWKTHVIRVKMSESE